MFRNTGRLASFAGALLLVTSAVALAAPGGKNASPSSISLLSIDATAVSVASDGPSYGDAVTFKVSTEATPQPFVHLTCSQNGRLVLETWQAWFYGAAGMQTFRLGPTPAWQGGEADCTAYLENWDSYSRNGRTPVLASTTFHVGA